MLQNFLFLKAIFEVLKLYIMKKNLLAAFAIATFALSTPLHATSFENDQIASIQIKSKGKYAIMVQNKMHLQAAIMTGEEILKANPKAKFEVVLIGEVVKDIADDTSLKPMLEKAHQGGIKIVSCEFAMKKLGVTKDQYLPIIDTTPNAFIYLFDLKEKGYNHIIL